MANFETLLSPSNVLLYGRVMLDLTYTHKPPPKTLPEEPPEGEEPGPPPRLGDNNFLEAQLAKSGAVLARIYAFSYEGHYYDLLKPAIFLVHGPGTDPEEIRPKPPYDRVYRAPADADRTGVAKQDYSFSHDIKVWSYDKGDFSVRLDIETGPYEQILLESELRSDKLQTYYSGAMVRMRSKRGGNLGD